MMERLFAVLEGYLEAKRANAFFDGTNIERNHLDPYTKAPDPSRSNIASELQETLECLKHEVLLPAFHNKVLGRLSYLPTETVIPDYKYAPRVGILDLIAEGDDALRRSYRQTDYFSDQLTRADEKTALIKTYRYRHLYHSIKNRGILFDAKEVKGLPLMFLARGSSDRDIAFRLDGTHRASIARHLGYQEIPTLVAGPEDLADLPNVPEKFRTMLETFTPFGDGNITTVPVDLGRDNVSTIITDTRRWYQDIEVLDGLYTITQPPTTIRKFVRLFRPPVSAMKNESLMSSLPHLSGRRVLDIGCNAGLHSFNAKWRGAETVTSIDMDQERIDQAHIMLELFKGLGRRTENVSFKRASIIENLQFLQEVDTVLACCVLYHVGPVDELKKAISDSPVDLFFFQCNTVRGNKIGKKNKPGHPHYEPNRKTWGNILGTVEGGRQFLEDCGFTIKHITTPDMQFPTLVGRRRL